MTLELSQLVDQVGGAAEEMARQRQEYDRLAQQALQLLHIYSDQTDFLKQRVKDARGALGWTWRGAAPTTEPIGVSVPLPAHTPPAENIIATDGSQIYPDRHAIALYGLTNIGAIHLIPGSGRPPEVFTDPRLLYGDMLQDEDQEQNISRERDKQELAKLVELSAQAVGSTVALMDSPLLLWILGQDRRGGRAGAQLLEWFVDQLGIAGAHEVRLAGYVDRPGSRGVADLLAVADTDPKELTESSPAVHRFRRMPDRTMFQFFLEPGDRSALFESDSPVNRKLDENRIAFFYMNVGSLGDPIIARVETPCWIASYPDRLDQLHATIWQQCQAPGRYPYVLARAHEIAVVTMEQRLELENMLAGSLLQRGITPRASAKSFLKTLTAG